MKPEKISYEALKEQFPELLDKCPIEVREGWYGLVWDMCEQLIAARKAKEIPIDGESPLYFVQIKEKFGTLRAYTDYSTEEDEKIIRMFEDMSQFVCDTCGEAGKIRGQYWVYTACDAHTNPKDR